MTQQHLRLDWQGNFPKSVYVTDDHGQAKQSWGSLDDAVLKHILSGKHIDTHNKVYLK